MITYLDDRVAIDRLKSEYLQHGRLVIGFDFDNTIYDYHQSGLDTTQVVTLLQQCSNLGFAMCLYTVISEDGMGESEKASYCFDRGINVSNINSSPLRLGHGKPFFSILLDDRAGLSSAYNVLRTALLELNLIT